MPRRHLAVLPAIVITLTASLVVTTTAQSPSPTSALTPTGSPPQAPPASMPPRPPKPAWDPTGPAAATTIDTRHLEFADELARLVIAARGGLSSEMRPISHEYGVVIRASAP